MKYLIISFFLTIWWTPSGDKNRDRITLSKAALYDKIKGGWAGKFIGVTYASNVKASASLEND